MEVLYKDMFKKMMGEWDSVRFELSPGPDSDVYFHEGKIFAAVGNEDGSVALQVFNMDRFKKVVDDMFGVFSEEHGFSYMDELLESDQYGEFVAAVMDVMETNNINPKKVSA
jgi:hypothetical protein